MKTYMLLTPSGKRPSKTPGTLGGNGRARIYGRLDCPSALRALATGDTYKNHVVFFANEETAKACGYRPCGNCMRAEYKTWKEASEKGDHDT